MPINIELTKSTLSRSVNISRLLQLTSPTLPVGGYAFSQGLEYAVELGWVGDMSQTHSWLSEQLQVNLAQVDLPIFFRLYGAFVNGDTENSHHWNDLCLACRETKELRLTDTAMGLALWQLLQNINTNEQIKVARPAEISYPWAFALASHLWRIEKTAAALGYLWSWLENQVMAATKLVPLGQTQAQQLLFSLQPQLEAALEISLHIGDDEIGSGLPALAIASAGHETQYSRLFRS